MLHHQVYGIKNEDNVNEDMDLEPLTDYSRFKADCEEIPSNYGSESFTVCTLRPATVCGYARRQRLDVVVTIFVILHSIIEKLQFLEAINSDPIFI